MFVNTVRTYYVPYNIDYIFKNETKSVKWIKYKNKNYL